MSRMLLLLTAALGAASIQRTTGLLGAEPAERFRRPIALQLAADEQLLYVANRDSGSVTMIDTQSNHVVAETDIGRRLSDLVRVPDRPWLLATDQEAHELLLLETTQDATQPVLRVRQRLAVSPYPVSVVVAADGTRCFVASLWSRRVTFVDLPQEKQPAAQVTAVMDLDIAPRKQLLVRGDSQLIVADSFRGRLAVLDTRTAKLQGLRQFPGHNIRGLGVSGDGRMLIIAQQMLNQLAHTERNDVHWGLLMSNDLRWARLDAVLDGQADLYEGGRMQPIGEAGRATGDPAGLVVAPNGRVLVTLGGVGEIAVGREPGFNLVRLRVGRRPTAVVVTSDSRRAFVANTFQDSVSVVDLEQLEATAKIPLGASGEPSLVQRGEMLFHDARLSHDGWMSCHSCHTDGHTNGLLNDNFADASFGAPKQVLSTMGRSGTAPFGWLATAEDLAAQIRRSVTNTMQTDLDVTEEQIGALVAYVESLPSPPSIDAVRGTADSKAIRRGERVFTAFECSGCHAAPTYTTPATYDVGLKDKLGQDHFNPPSLRGVGQRGPYFHDNRAESLTDVLVKHQHQLSRPLEADELNDLLAFLRSL